MGLEVSRLPKQEVVWLLPQQNLRGRMGFLYRTQTSWQETALLSCFWLWFPFGGSAFTPPICCLSFQAIPSPCLTQINSIVLHDMTATCPNCLNKQLQPWQDWPPGGEITGAKCEAFSNDKCWSVTAVLKDCLSTGLTNCGRRTKRRETETKTRIQKTAGGGRGRCKYSNPPTDVSQRRQEVG